MMAYNEYGDDDDGDDDDDGSDDEGMSSSSSSCNEEKERKYYYRHISSWRRSVFLDDEASEGDDNDDDHVRRKKKRRKLIDDDDEEEDIDEPTKSDDDFIASDDDESHHCSNKELLFYRRVDAAELTRDDDNAMVLSMLAEYGGNDDVIDSDQEEREWEEYTRSYGREQYNNTVNKHGNMKEVHRITKTTLWFSYSSNGSNDAYENRNNVMSVILQGDERSLLDIQRAIKFSLHPELITVSAADLQIFRYSASDSATIGERISGLASIPDILLGVTTTTPLHVRRPVEQNAELIDRVMALKRRLGIATLGSESSTILRTPEKSKLRCNEIERNELVDTITESPVLSGLLQRPYEMRRMRQYLCMEQQYVLEKLRLRRNHSWGSRNVLLALKKEKVKKTSTCSSEAKSLPSLQRLGQGLKMQPLIGGSAVAPVLGRGLVPGFTVTLRADNGGEYANSFTAGIKPLTNFSSSQIRLSREDSKKKKKLGATKMNGSKKDYKRPWIDKEWGARTKRRRSKREAMERARANISSSFDETSSSGPSVNKRDPNTPLSSATYVTKQVPRPNRHPSLSKAQGSNILDLLTSKPPLRR